MPILTLKGRQRRERFRNAFRLRGSNGAPPTFAYEYTIGKKRNVPLPPITVNNTSVQVASSELDSFKGLTGEYKKLRIKTVSADCMGHPDDVGCLGIYHFAVEGQGVEEGGVLSSKVGLTDDPNNQGQYTEMMFAESPKNATMGNSHMLNSQILSCEYDVGISRASSIAARTFAYVDCMPITEEHDLASNKTKHQQLWETAVQFRVQFLKDVIEMFKNLKCLILHGKWAIKFVLIEHGDVFLPFLKSKNIAIPQGDMAVFHDSLLSSWKIDMMQARHYYETYSKAYACMMGLPTPPPLDIYKVVFVFHRYIKEHVIYEGYYNGVLTLLGFSKGNMQKLISDAGMTGDAIDVSKFPSQEQILEQGNAYMVRGLELRLKNVTLHNVKFGIKNQSSYDEWKRENAGDQVTVNNMINQVREHRAARNVNEGDEEEEVEGITDEMVVTLKGMKSDEW